MKKNYLHYIFPILYSLAFAFFSYNSSAQCNNTDWNALKALYSSTEGQFWLNKTNWNQVTSNSPPANCNLGSMYGITLNSSGRVSEVDLSNNLLSGSIPSQFYQMSNLRKVNLSKSELSGTLSSNFGNLFFLEELNLAENDFTGSIPNSYGNINNLKILDLKKNLLSGVIPFSLGNLTGLTILDLGNNNIGDYIPVELCELNNLTKLNLRKNNLTGKIPPELCGITSLIELDLSHNSLDGDIPIEIGNLSDLEILSLSNNSLGPNFPQEIGFLSKLKKLDLANNIIQDDIPEEVGEIIVNSLESLDLYDNTIRGGIKVIATSLAKRQRALVGFRIANNQMTWVCPPTNLGTFCIDNILPSDIDPGNYFTTTWDNFCMQLCEGTSSSGLRVWPGDTNLDGKVNAKDYLPIVEKLFYLQTGPARTNNHKNNEWYGHPVPEWGIKNEYGLDIAHLDCNGDGIINENDQLAIDININNNHPESWAESPESEFQSERYTDAGGSNLTMQLVEMNSASNNRTRVGINLSNGDGTYVHKLYSGYFTILFNEPISNATVNLSDLGSWLGNNVEVFTNILPSNKRMLEVAFIKSDGVASSDINYDRYIGYVEYESSSSNNAQRTVSSNCFQTFDTQQMRMNDDFSNPIPLSNTSYVISGSCTNSDRTVNASGFPNDCYNYTGTISTSGNVVLNNNEQAEFRANRVRLNTGFKVRAGAYFRAVYGCM